MKIEPFCAVCGAGLTQARRGRRRRYCSRSCQARAYRARRDAVPPRPRRTTRSHRLTTVGITRAAVEFADHEGLEALSMRRLATDLGVATATLYRYFADRDALLSEMVELVLGEFPSPPTERADWRGRLARQAHAESQLYQRHPWILPVLAATRPPVGPALLDILERTFSALDRPHIPTETLLAIYLTLSGLVQGLALMPYSERGPVQSAAPAAEDFRTAALALISPETHPTLARRFAQTTAEPDLDFDRLLDHGLALLLDGITARHLQPHP